MFKGLHRLFQTRFKGVRIIDLSAFAMLAGVAMSVYAYKAHEGGETAQLADVDRAIADEQRQIRVLEAELARLEQPARLERLSARVLGLQPVKAAHETTASGLIEISHQPTSSATPPPGATSPVNPVAAQAGATQP